MLSIAYEPFQDGRRLCGHRTVILAKKQGPRLKNKAGQTPDSLHGENRNSRTKNKKFTAEAMRKKLCQQRKENQKARSTDRASTKRKKDEPSRTKTDEPTKQANALIGDGERKTGMIRPPKKKRKTKNDLALLLANRRRRLWLSRSKRRPSKLSGFLRSRLIRPGACQVRDCRPDFLWPGTCRVPGLPDFLRKGRVNEEDFCRNRSTRLRRRRPSRFPTAWLRACFQAEKWPLFQPRAWGFPDLPLLWRSCTD